MKLAAIKKRREPSDNNLIPMINVVFLLLIFFMVAGTIRASDPFPLDPLNSEQQKSLDIPIVLFMSNGGKLIYEGAAVTPTTLSQLLINSEEDPDVDSSLNLQSISLKADSRVTISQLRELLDSLREAGIQQVELVTTLISPVNTQ